VTQELLDAARVLSREGLVDAFGHVSERTDDGAARITPVRPLGELSSSDELVALPLDELGELPPGVPKEGWIHWGALRALPAVGAVCRAQPPAIVAVAAVASELPALFGQAALVGAPVPIFDDARLIRDRPRGEALAALLASGAGHADGAVLRGNGAVTTGATVGEAVARMVLLERSATTWLAASGVGEPRPLSDDEVAAWRGTAGDLLRRLWAHLRA
jgi:ribulose-5-phosphate 4-epimerase/fuculose-1-phosphate aldolase